MSRGRKACNIYCIRCGTENNKQDKKCKKCHKKLKSWNILFFSFFWGQLRSNTLDIVTGDTFDAFKTFLMNCSFGIIFTVSVTFASITTIINYLDSNLANNDNITIIDQKLESLNTCSFVSIADMMYKCSEGYVLNDQNKCEKLVTTNATENKVCATGYKLSNNKCLSNEATPMNESPSCEAFAGYGHEIVLTNRRITIHKENLISAEVDTKLNACHIKWCWDPSTIDWEIKECMGSISGTDIDRDLYHIKKSCPSGLNEINGSCYKTDNYKIEYSCSIGELNGKKCVISEEIEAAYECPNGFTYNEECQVCVGDKND